METHNRGLTSSPTDGLQVDETQMNGIPNHFDTQGLEALPAEQNIDHGASAPQPVPAYEKQAIAASDSFDDGKQISEDLDTAKHPVQSRFRRRRKIWLLVACVIIIIIVIAVAVPVATRKKDSTDDSDADSAPSTVASSGAFNGTRLTTFNPEANTFPTSHLFYQDYTTQIRRIEKQGEDPNFTWSGGSEYPPITLPSPARNATPLASVNYTDSSTGLNTAHLFYINQTNYLQEVISTDNLTTWVPGPLTRSNFQASPDSIAMTALHDLNRFGTTRNDSAGIRLYYGGTDNMVQEAAYALGNDSWAFQSTLRDTNGNAGISIAGVNAEGVAQLYCLRTDNSLIVWEGDFMTKAVPRFSTYGKWDSGQIFVYGLAVNSSLAYSLGHVGFQDQFGTVQIVESFGPGSGKNWGEVLAVGNDTAVGTRVHAGIGIGAGSVYLGDAIRAVSSDAYSLDVIFQTDDGTVMECLDKNAQFTCKPVPTV